MRCAGQIICTPERFKNIQSYLPTTLPDGVPLARNLHRRCGVITNNPKQTENTGTRPDAVVGVITNNSKQTENTGTRPRRLCWCYHQQPEANGKYRNPPRPPLLVLSPTTRRKRKIPEPAPTPLLVLSPTTRSKRKIFRLSRQSKFYPLQLFLRAPLYLYFYAYYYNELFSTNGVSVKRTD